MYTEGGGGSGGEFSASKNLGAFQLLGASSPDFSFDQNYGGPAGTVGYAQGLIRETHSVPGMANQNFSTNAFLAGNPVGTTALVSVSAADTGGLPVDTLVESRGYLEVQTIDDIDLFTAGIQVKFRIDSDDNAVFDIRGIRVLENDGGHGLGHFYADNENVLSDNTGDNTPGVTIWSFPTVGLYPIYSYVHNGGGGGSGEIQSSIGIALGAGLQQIPDARLFSIPEPSSLALASCGFIALMARFRKRRV